MSAPQRHRWKWQGTGVFAFAMILSGCGLTTYDADKHPLAPVDPLIRMGIGSAAVPADGASVVEVRLDIPANARTEARQVTFTSTAGVFDSGKSSIQVTADADGHALAVLHAPATVSLANVTATAGVATQTGTVDFVRAYPERVAIEPREFVLPDTASKETVLNIQLLRALGRPTAGLLVQLAALDTLGDPFGELGATPGSDDAGRVAVRLTTLGAGYRGRVSVTVRAPSDSIGDFVSATTTLQIVGP